MAGPSASVCRMRGKAERRLALQVACWASVTGQHLTRHFWRRNLEAHLDSGYCPAVLAGAAYGARGANRTDGEVR